LALGIVMGICLLNIISMQDPSADPRLLKVLICLNYVGLIAFHFFTGGIPRAVLVPVVGFFSGALLMTAACRGDIFATFGWPIIAASLLLLTFEKPRFSPPILTVLRTILALSVLTAVAPFGHTDYDEGYFPFRVNGIAGHANGLGGYALLTYLVDDMLRNRWFTKTKALVLVTLVLAQSKTAFLLIPIYHALKYGLPHFEQRPRVLMGLYIGCFLVLCLASVAYAQSSDYSVSETGFTGRTILWKIAVTQWQAHPWLGVGIGAMWKDSATLALMAAESSFVPSYSHNLYIQYLTECGILGAAFFCILLAYCLTRISTRACFVAACITFIFLRGLSEVPLVFWPYSDNFVQVFILLSVTWKTARPRVKA
jgi:O-antigen ligase